MLAFLKSELFLKFAGGFALGTVGLFLFNGEEPATLTTAANAAPAAIHAPL